MRSSEQWPVEGLGYELYIPFAFSPRIMLIYPAMINSINLPSPQPLLPSLLEAGFGHELATAASKLYQGRAEEFRRRTETSLIAACQKIGTSPGASASPLDLLTRKDIITFTEVYLRCLEEWKQEMLQLLRQASIVPSKAAPPRNSRSFNHEYLPLLEHFFEENPFPTHADKVFLAEKSNMQYRQIHVWFQNRRNRTKKEGKPLRKKPISEGTTKPLDKLYERMKGYVVKPVSRTLQPSRESSWGVEGVDDQLRTTQNNAPKCVFTVPPPPHAFPSAYPPTCAYDPFSCTSGPIAFEKPEWKRVPCSKPPLSVSISMDDLIERFSQLNVRCDTRVKRSPRLRSPAATAAITIMPSRAPHPSLIVSKQPGCADAVLHLPSVRASVSRLHTFKGFNPTSKPVALVSPPALSHRSEPPAKRKTASLPRRFPGRMQDAKRDSTPSECSSTSSSSHIFSVGSTSRSSSLSSGSSSSSPRDMASTQELPRSPSYSPFQGPPSILASREI